VDCFQDKPLHAAFLRLKFRPAPDYFLHFPLRDQQRLPPTEQQQFKRLLDSFKVIDAKLIADRSGLGHDLRKRLEDLIRDLAPPKRFTRFIECGNHLADLTCVWGKTPV